MPRTEPEMCKTVFKKLSSDNLGSLYMLLES